MQAGFGMTHPDPGWHPEGFHIFDVGYEAQDDSQEIKTRVARPLGNLLQAAAGFCNEGLCKVSPAWPNVLTCKAGPNFTVLAVSTGKSAPLWFLLLTSILKNLQWTCHGK